MNLEKILSIFTVFFFQLEWSNGMYIVMSILQFAGMWGIFRKCGLKGWHALIPCLRDDKLGEAVGMEKEGRVAALLTGAMILLG